MLDNEIYNSDFHKNRDLLTRHSAEKIIGLVHDYFQDELKSVCDVGCGTGTWLSVFKNIYPDIQIQGFDGDYIRNQKTEINKDDICYVDLNSYIPIGRKYDIAISLEVAEHLDRERGDSFIEDLVALSDIVLFSAAIPGQGGEGHVNECFLSEWVERFGKHGYILCDCIRPYIDDDKNVCWWYRQNVVIFLNENSDSGAKKRMEKAGIKSKIDWIDKELYVNKLGYIQRLEAFIAEQNEVIIEGKAFIENTLKVN